MRHRAPASTITFTAATSAVWGDAFYIAREYLDAEKKIQGDPLMLDLKKGERCAELLNMLDDRAKDVVALSRRLGGVPVAITIPVEKEAVA